MGVARAVEVAEQLLIDELQRLVLRRANREGATGQDGRRVDLPPAQCQSDYRR